MNACAATCAQYVKLTSPSYADDDVIGRVRKNLVTRQQLRVSASGGGPCRGLRDTIACVPFL